LTGPWQRAALATVRPWQSTGPRVSITERVGARKRWVTIDDIRKEAGSAAAAKVASALVRKGAPSEKLPLAVRVVSGPFRNALEVSPRYNPAAAARSMSRSARPWRGSPRATGCSSSATRASATTRASGLGGLGAARRPWCGWRWSCGRARSRRGGPARRGERAQGPGGAALGPRPGRGAAGGARTGRDGPGAGGRRPRDRNRRSTEREGVGARLRAALFRRPRHAGPGAGARGEAPRARGSTGGSDQGGVAWTPGGGRASL
jgi:hypothetical protein